MRKKDLEWWCFVLPTQSCVLMALPNDVYLPPFLMYMIVIDLIWIKTFGSIIFVKWSARRTMVGHWQGLTKTTLLAYYLHQGQQRSIDRVMSCAHTNKQCWEHEKRWSRKKSFRTLYCHSRPWCFCFSASSFRIKKGNKLKEMRQSVRPVAIDRHLSIEQ